MMRFRLLLIEKMSQTIPWLRSLILAAKKVGVLEVDPSGFLYVIAFSYDPSGAGHYYIAC